MEHLSVDLGVTVGRVRLRNPILTASGTFGYGAEFEAFQALSALGGLVTKGLTLEARAGNPPRRIAETPGGMLNSIGLQNVGVETFLAEKLPRLREAGTRVIVNLCGKTPDEYVELAHVLDGAEGVDALELNVSCPNVDKGGREFGTDAGVLYSLVYDVRQATRRLPLWVKLSPSVTDLGSLARSCEAGGADAVVAINTLTAAQVRPVWEGSRLRADILRGGLSGPAVKPVALRAVWEIRQAVKIPVVGVGGITSAEDVLEFLAVGAQAIQVGTANFYDPGLAARLPAELAAILAARGVTSLEELARGILALEQAT
jgi:dihydroorotate dehydrogenase (NAD+) catalytic subunit